MKAIGKLFKHEVKKFPNNSSLSKVNMNNCFHSVALICLSSLVSACTLNSVDLLPSGDKPSGNRAVLIYGVEMTEALAGSGLKTELAEYDLSKKNISGNCFHFNRTEANVDVNRAEINYFAFDVPAGVYVLSPFSSFRINAAKQDAFVAKPGSSVYVGTYQYFSGLRMRFDRNLPLRMEGIRKALPNLGDVTTAEVMVVDSPTPFMCTP